MRQFQPFFTINLPIHAIKKSTEKAILVQYHKNTKEKDYVWFPRGWLYNIKYRKVKNKIDNTTITKITLVFYGFLETELRLKMAEVISKSKKPSKMS